MRSLSVFYIVWHINWNGDLREKFNRNEEIGIKH